MDIKGFYKKFERFKELKEKKKISNLNEPEIEEYNNLINDLEKFLLDNPLIGQQRRKHLRADISLEAEVVTGGMREFCKCSTIGSGGIFLQTRSKIPVGRKVKIKIKLPNNEYLSAEGKVLYQSGTEGIGLQFSDIEEKKVNELKELLVEYYGNLLTG